MGHAPPVARIPLILDCDPGVDDGVALLMAFAAREEIELLAVTTVGGNVGLALTSRNARLIRQVAGRDDVPVYAGRDKAMLVAGVTGARDFHGETGLGHLEVFEPSAPLTEGHAANAIVEMVMARREKTVTVAVLGPMTNLALALLLEPRLAGRLKQVVAMGGARREGGNITASAEFNIWADPHAAQVVVASGCPLVLMGLDATFQVRTTAERLAAIRAIGTPKALAATELLSFTRSVYERLAGDADSPLHDPTTIAWLLRPDLFETRFCRLEIETGSELTRGHTAVEFRLGDGPAPHVQWTTRVDAEGFHALLRELLARP
jgi:purine nucleosidase